MHPKELKELIATGESSTLEFKRKVPSLEKIAKEISAFANTIGGSILVGVDDDGTIVGVNSEKTEMEAITVACQFYIQAPIEPEFEIVSFKGKDVLVVYIKESKNKPHKVLDENIAVKSQQRAYIRVGESSMIASREMSRLLASQNPDAKPLTISIGDREKRLFAYLEKNEKITVKEFAKLVNISTRRSERLLISLVRAEVLQIHIHSDSDYFTLVEKIT